jgi:glycosyltransferase involved in cell wall biosynthesis
MISALAERLGLRRGSSLIPLGYLDDSVYYALLNRAWALVMPTRAEGGGSFPVEEAVRSGVPVVCSGIPVMREHMDRLGAEVLWFDPADPDDLALRLRELEADYARYKRRAVEQIADLRRRSWRDVADDYWNAFHPT